MLNSYVRNKFTIKVAVKEKTKIAPNVYKLILSGKALTTLDYKIGQHMHFLVQPDTNQSMLKMSLNRNYSIWNHCKTKGIMHLAICTFSTGPGSKWIEDLSPLDSVFFTSPSGNFLLDTTAKNHIFVGDSSTLGHFYFLKNNLHSSSDYSGFIYNSIKENHFCDLDGSTPFNHIAENKDTVELLFQKVASRTIIAPDQTRIYLGGNADIIQPLRTKLKKELNWPNQQLTLKPFWKKGKKGM